MTRWHDVHAGFLRCSSMRSRVESILPPLGGLHRVVERRHVRRRRRRRRAEQHFHHPLAALHRRGAIGDRGQRQDAALAEQAAAVLGQRHAAERVAVTFGNAVVLRQPLVDEACSRRSAGRARGRSSRTMLSKNSSVSRCIACGERVVVLRDRAGSRDGSSRGPAAAATAHAKRVDERFGAPIGQHAPHLLLEARRASGARRRCAAFSSSASGTVPQRKNDSRDARS